MTRLVLSRLSLSTLSTHCVEYVQSGKTVKKSVLKEFDYFSMERTVFVSFPDPEWWSCKLLLIANDFFLPPSNSTSIVNVVRLGPENAKDRKLHGETFLFRDIKAGNFVTGPRRSSIWDVQHVRHLTGSKHKGKGPISCSIWDGYYITRVGNFEFAKKCTDHGAKYHANVRSIDYFVILLFCGNN